MSRFKMVCETRASDMVPVRKYVSERTGMTVIIAGVEGLSINGSLCLATETYDDDGLPKILEHLIFFGSKKYPYKGIIDLLGNRYFSQGSNARTDTDYTCYKIHTARAEEMLALLPIYLDHVLFPTLTEHGYVTEVHHVNGEGEDAGVVYCEMQDRENLGDSRCYLNLLRALYPGGGYSSDTEGIIENLRTSTNIIKVQDFHKKFYRAENLTIILTGQIEPADVFKALETVEDDIIANNAAHPPEPWQRPWQKIPPPPNYGVFDVQWPAEADTEDCGQMWFGWMGPKLCERDSLKQLEACSLMLRYLADTPTSPLQRQLVGIEDALAGDVSFNYLLNMSSCLLICLEDVPLTKLQQARKQALDVIGKIRCGEENLDMERLHGIVKKHLRKTMDLFESNPHHAIADKCINDMLYGNTDEDFISHLNRQVHLKELMLEPEDYWLKLLQTYFIEDTVTILGSPSIELRTKMAQEEKARIEAQREKLGAEGLAEKAKILEEAVTFNEREPPADMLAYVPISSCSALDTFSISTWATDSPEPCPHFDLSAVPLYTRVHNIHTNFIYMNLVFDLTEVSQLTRKWLTTVVGAWGQLPVRRGGELVPYEVVCAELEEISVEQNKQIGYTHYSWNYFTFGPFGNYACFKIRCEPSEYERVVQALWEVFFSAEVTKERLLVIAEKIINDGAKTLRQKGKTMVNLVLCDALSSEDSNTHWNSVLRQQTFLTEVLKRLNAGEVSEVAVLAEATEAYRRISSSLWLHIATDLERYKLSSQPWANFRKENETDVRQPRLHWDKELMSSKCGGCVVGVEGVESCFLLKLCSDPLSYSHKDIGPIMLLFHYFAELEGSGLSYDYSIVPVLNEGRMFMSLFTWADVVDVYTKAKGIIEEYLSGDSFDEHLFMWSKNATIFNIVENAKCPSDLAYQSLMQYFKRVSDKYNRDMISAMSAVTPAEAREVGARWLPTLFDPALSYTTVVCNPSKVQEVKAAFHNIGVDFEAYETIESSHYN